MRSSKLFSAVLLVMGLTPALDARADEVERGRRLASSGKCDEAIPLLESAEQKKHGPGAAASLARCYEKKDRLLDARAQYEKVAAHESQERGWNFYDVIAWRSAKKKLAALDERIPTVTVELEESYAEAQVEVNGEPVEIGKPTKVDPGKSTVTARAPGYADATLTLELVVGARENVALQLAKQPRASPKPDPPPAPKYEPDEAEPEAPIDWWLGARYAGSVLPQFLMNAFGDGGATLVVPGAAVTATIPTEGPELVLSLAFSSYRLGETPYKPNGTPDTDYEIIESDLKSFTLALDVMWTFPFTDDETVSFRIGAAVGVGFMVIGNLVRTQSHPPNMVPGDPETYVKCRGPNDPPGSFRYCNQLDKDADHYDFFKEPNWFEGGSRPLIYPWLAVPIGLTFKPIEELAIDVETGFSVGGFLTNAGIRYGI